MISFSNLPLWKKKAKRASATVPPMDGALLPNEALDSAPVLATIQEPDNLAVRGDELLFSSGSAVYAIDRQRRGALPQRVETFAAPVTCLAVDGRNGGGFAVGLDDGRIIFRGGRGAGRELTSLGGKAICCLTALAFHDNQLLVCQGTAYYPAAQWKADLMNGNASGSVWRIDTASLESTCLADRLAFPYGVTVSSSGAVVVSESWQHRLLAIEPDRLPTILLEDLPGYPARITVSADGTGAWLAVFAPRRQLIEFVLRERAYRVLMMRDMPPEDWIAPELSSGRSLLEPLLGGSVKHLGILKPWAPMLSYGLVVRLDSAWQPVASYHSRANGNRHGITSIADVGDAVIAASKGGDAIIAIDPSTNG